MNKLDAVFEGGGVKGIAFAGALHVAEEKGYADWQNVAGTSAGAIAASMIASGYSASELFEVMRTLDYTNFKDGQSGLFGKAFSLLTKRGIYKGDFFHSWLADMLSSKGVQKFGDLRTEFEEERYRYKLQVIVSDVSRKRLLILPHDLQELGIEPDEFHVADAVRMSMSIPFFFEPAKLAGNTVVDGGLLSNFPVWLFDSVNEPEWPTFGFKLVTPKELDPNHRIKTRSAIDLGRAIVSTMLSAHDARLEEASNRVRTIHINTLDVGTTDFDLTDEQVMALYESGKNAAEAFFRDWDFDEYKLTFRE